MPRINRRQALAGVSSALLLPLAGCATARRGAGTNAAFAHGVASGDPDHSSVVLWTRISGQNGTVGGTWRIAADPRFRDIVDSGKFGTDASRDHTVKVLADGLEPGRQYFYDFRTDGYRSATGRTRTLPTGHVERLGIAAASCANFPFGFFNAYEAIANDPAIDLVLHLGDYIYEYGPDGYGGPTGAMIGRVHEPPHETVTLRDYRVRHAQYKADPGSRAMHAAHPLVAIWDDHESANNPWMGGAENHQPEAEGAWSERRRASLQAYFEWMPVREPGNASDRSEYWRHFRFGDLASLVTLETRHTGRAEQLLYSEHLADIATMADRDRFLRDVLGAPGRTMISDAMATFVHTALSEAVEAGRTWRIIGNQIPMARNHVPRLDHPFFARRESDETDPVAAELARLKRLGELDLPLYLDPWDGYPWARERFYELCTGSGATDLLVLTGDSHSFWANALYDAAGESMGLEIGTAGITSPGDFVAFGPEGAELMDRLLAEHNREVTWTDGRHPGYVRVELTHETGRADFVTVTDILSADYDVRVLNSVDIARENSHLRYV
jgi:alkaline phosphatase D